MRTSVVVASPSRASREEDSVTLGLRTNPIVESVLMSLLELPLPPLLIFLIRLALGLIP